MTAVDGLRTGMLIGGGIWVENPDIKKGPLKSSTPEPTHSNVKPCALLGVGSSMGKGFAFQGLEMGLNSNIVIYFAIRLCSMFVRYTYVRCSYIVFCTFCRCACVGVNCCAIRLCYPCERILCTLMSFFVRSVVLLALVLIVY